MSVVTTAPTNVSARDLARCLSRAGLHRLSANAIQTLCEIQDSGVNAFSMSHLARLLEVSTAGMTCVADSLETAGLVKRTPSPRDRRVIWLSLTPKGKIALYDILNA